MPKDNKNTPSGKGVRSSNNHRDYRNGDGARSPGVDPITLTTSDPPKPPKK